MPSRVGITTVPSVRKGEWELLHPDMMGWRIVSRHHTMTMAQAMEMRVGRELDCVCGAGGRGPENGTWSVYTFDTGNAEPMDNAESTDKGGPTKRWRQELWRVICSGGRVLKKYWWVWEKCSWVWEKISWVRQNWWFRVRGVSA